MLTDHEVVAEAAVIGIPDERFGEIPVGYVVLRSGEVADGEVLKDYCSSRLASYKVPVWIAVVDDLPRGPTGKTLKRVLRDQTDVANKPPTKH